MLLLRLWNYVRGYVIILVEGYFYEKFLNICTHRQIFLWDIKKTKDCVLTLKISIRGFKLLRPIARKTGCKIRIARKCGLPFVLNRYRRRKTFFLGAILFVILIYFLTSFIWEVEITGNKNLDEQVLRERLMESGIRPGVLKYGIDVEKATGEMMSKIEELAWLSITVKGTKVKVQLAERKLPPELVPRDKPCNIVARRDGIVVSMTVKDGVKMVKVGDTVTRGQILVSGTIPVKNQEGVSRFVHAIASVVARTWYESEWPVCTVITQRELTGRKKDHHSIRILGMELDLFHGKVEYEDFEKTEIRKRVAIGEDLVLPFEWIIYRYAEVNAKDVEITTDEAKNIAVDKAYEVLTKKIPGFAEVVRTDISFRETPEGGRIAVITAECLEEIGAKQMIGG